MAGRHPAPADSETGSDAGAENFVDVARDAGIEDLCSDGLARGVAGQPRLVAKLAPEPEGVAVCANGDVFVSIPAESKILRVPLTGGEPELWTTLPERQPLGMTCVGSVLYVVDFRSKDAAVMRITGQNDPGTALPKIDGDKGYSALNAIVSVPGIGLFASDGSNGAFGRISSPRRRRASFQFAAGGRTHIHAVEGARVQMHIEVQTRAKPLHGPPNRSSL